MKKIKILIGFIFLLLLTMGASANTAAEVLQTNDINFKLFGSAVCAPYSGKMASQQEVHIGTGALNLSVVDLTLPGKNGLDLVIRRSYNSQKNGDIPYCMNKAVFRWLDIYCYLYEHTNGSTLYINFHSEEEMLHYAADTVWVSYTDSQLHTSKTGEKFIFFDEMTITSENTGTKLTRVKDQKMKHLQYDESTRLDYATDMSLLDIGNIKYNWNWDIPILCNLDIDSDFTNYTRYYEALRDYKGNVYRAYYNLPKKGDKDNIQFYIQNGTKTTEEIVVKESHWDDYTDETGLTYNLALEDKDGIIMYFYRLAVGMKHYKIAAVEDKYGNRITYNHLDNGNIAITDTYGRVVTLSDDGIAYPDPETGELQQITYEYNIVNDAQVDPYSVLSADNDYQYIVTDAFGNSTTYHMKQHNPAYSRYIDDQKMNQLTAEYYRKKNNIGWESSETYAITKIDHPTGYQSQYDYQRYYSKLQSNLMQVRHKVVHSKDIVGETSLNNQTYTYVRGEQDGIHSNITSGAVIRDSDQVKLEKNYGYYYLDAGKLFSETLYSSSGSKISYVSYVYSTLNHLKSITRKKYSSANDFVTNSTEYTYDDRYHITKEITDGHTIDYTYSDQNLMLTKTWKQDANTTILIENTPTEDGKSVAKSVTKVNGVIQSQTAYEYASDGMVTKQILWEGDTNEDGIWDENDKTVTVNSDYTYNDNTTYSVERYVTGAEDIDGTTLPKIGYTTAYDYNGNVKTVTDPRGNSTTYQYDSVSRPLRETFSDATYQLMEYNVAQNYMIYQDANGIQTKSQFNPLGWLTSAAIKDGNEWIVTEEYTYDSIGRRLSKKQYLTPTTWETTEYTYNWDGDVIQERTKNQAGDVISGADYDYYYSAQKQISTTVLGSGCTTRQYFDISGYLVKEEQIGASTRTKTYVNDYMGNCISAKDANAVKNSWGDTVTATYDYAGNILTQTDALGNTVSSHGSVGKIHGCRRQIHLLYLR